MDHPNFRYGNTQAAQQGPNGPPGFNYQPRPQAPQAYNTRPQPQPAPAQNQGSSIEDLIKALASNTIQFQ